MTKPTGRPTGRPPVPTELKLLQGNPGKRPIKGKPTGVIPGRIPPAPSALGKPGREAWRRYWDTGRAWLALSDMDALAQLCELHDDIATLRDSIAADGGLMVQSENNERHFVHAAYNDVRGIRNEMRVLWSALYMTPTDRARANLEPPKDDPVGDWEASG